MFFFTFVIKTSTQHKAAAAAAFIWPKEALFWSGHWAFSFFSNCFDPIRSRCYQDWVLRHNCWPSMWVQLCSFWPWLLWHCFWLWCWGSLWRAYQCEASITFSLSFRFFLFHFFWVDWIIFDYFCPHVLKWEFEAGPPRLITNNLRLYCS